ncbi:hypothetical protein Tco_0731509 [Tanacetum coccineum]
MLVNRNRRQQQQTLPVVVEPCNLEEPIPEQTIVAMADRTMEELLRAPTEGYREAIVLPKINADHFEIKTNLLQLVQANPFHGLENENLMIKLKEFLVMMFQWAIPLRRPKAFTSEFTLEEIDAYLYDKSITLESDHDR